jgi:hypothetical protein
MNASSNCLFYYLENFKKRRKWVREPALRLLVHHKDGDDQTVDSETLTESDEEQSPDG